MHKYISQVKLQVTSCVKFKIIEHNYCTLFLPTLIIYIQLQFIISQVRLTFYTGTSPKQTNNFTCTMQFL